MNTQKLMIAAALATFVSLPVVAQTCKDSIEYTVHPDQLINNGDGTVTDAKTGLMWTQCSFGQEWSENGCSGSPMNLEWDEALLAAQVFNEDGGLAEKADWRVPNIKELGSIVEHKCHSPAISLDYFPDTPSATYFSSTVKKNEFGAVAGGRTVDFTWGTDLTPEVSVQRHVRFVRSN